MDGKGNRGAYAQVTAPIGDETKVTVEQGSKSPGMCASCTPKRIVAFIVAVIIVIILIIVIVFISTKGNKSAQSVQVTTIAPNVSKEMMTTLAPPPTTFGPPVAGSFEGIFVMDRVYANFFDDVRAAKTDEFKTNITSAMDLVFSDSNAPYMYLRTDVDQLLKNGTNVQVEFTVSLDAINRGARVHLLETLGSTPSKNLATFRVLYADIKPEKKLSLDA